MPDRRAGRLAVAALAVVLAACAAPVAPPPKGGERVPAGFPAGHYQELLAQGRPVLRVDPVRSLVAIEVRRGGSLAQFGHDHVVASHDVAGYVAPDEGRADVYVPLATLVVDEPALRTEARLDTQPSAADIEGTRRNMQDKVLEVERHPYALIAVRAVDGGGSARLLHAAVTLHGTTRSVDVDAGMEPGRDGMDVTGTALLDQSAFGITPFSILGGAIAVQDRVKVTFRIHASRAD
jgi:hypothetical protein